MAAELEAMARSTHPRMCRGCHSEQLVLRMRSLATALKTIILVYAGMVIAALVSIPIGYFLIAPVWHLLHALPLDITKYALEAAWSLALCIVVMWIIEDYWPQAADQLRAPAQPLPLRLEDQAPWLQSVPVAEDAASRPALSPPWKSLPAPARDSGN